MEFDAVLFDAGGVFILPDPKVMAAILEPYGGSVDPARYHRAHYRAMCAKSHAGDGETFWGGYHWAYAESVGVRRSDINLAVAMLDDMMSPYLWRGRIDDNSRGLADVAATGVPVGVVSNASGQVEAELARLGVCQVGPGQGTEVRVVVDSEVVGVAKPDPKIFEFALLHFPGIERSRIAYVGDSVTMDVEGSRAAGLVPILIDPYDDHANIDVRRIRRVSELVAAG